MASVLAVLATVAGIVVLYFQIQDFRRLSNWGVDGIDISKNFFSVNDDIRTRGQSRTTWPASSFEDFEVYST